MRVLVNTQGVATMDFTAGNASGPVTVTVRRRADNALVTTGSATQSGPGGHYEFSIPPQTLVDSFYLIWSGTWNSVSQSVVSYANIVGGFLCPIADLMSEFPTLTQEECGRLRDIAEQRIENACNQAFVPRYMLQRTYGYTRKVRLAWPSIRALRDFTVGGLTYTSQLSSYYVTAGGYINGIPFGGPIFVGYEHGADFAPDTLRIAVILAAQEVSAANGGDGDVIRREADRQAVTFASPSGSSGDGVRFQNAELRSIVRDHRFTLIR